MLEAPANLNFTAKVTRRTTRRCDTDVTRKIDEKRPDLTVTVVGDLRSGRDAVACPYERALEHRYPGTRWRVAR
jgi:hypothetical protein